MVIASTSTSRFTPAPRRTSCTRCCGTARAGRRGPRSIHSSRFSYLHLSGLPVRDYRADVDLEPNAEGTRIRWHVSFSPKVPGTGWLLRWGITRFVTQCARGLAAYAPTATADEP
ncbi:MAG TPA: SRPBCC family protein [Pseudonocardiaceae bacterium]